MGATGASSAQRGRDSYVVALRIPRRRRQGHRKPDLYRAFLTAALAAQRRQQEQSQWQEQDTIIATWQQQGIATV